MDSDASATVRVTHRYAESPESVFAAFLDPARASRFLFATETGEMVRADIDARVGGAFTLTDRRDGEDVEHVGTWVDIDWPRRLVFDFAVPKYSAAVTRVSINVVPVGNGCELTLSHDHVPSEEAERARHGWSTVLDQLERVLA